MYNKNDFEDLTEEQKDELLVVIFNAMNTIIDKMVEDEDITNDLSSLWDEMNKNV